MKTSFFIVFMAFSSFSFGQADTMKSSLLEFEYDSCSLTVWDIYFKELSLPSDSEYESRKLADVKLSVEESDKIRRTMMDSKSYDGIRANLSHHDIVIQFYQSGQAVLKVEISAMTGNIDINNLSSGYYFQNNCSTSFGKTLLSLLNTHGVIELIEYDEVDLEGLK